MVFSNYNRVTMNHSSEGFIRTNCWQNTGENNFPSEWKCIALSIFTKCWGEIWKVVVHEHNISSLLNNVNSNNNYLFKLWLSQYTLKRLVANLMRKQSSEKTQLRLLNPLVSCKQKFNDDRVKEVLNYRETCIPALECFLVRQVQTCSFAK